MLSKNELMSINAGAVHWVIIGGFLVLMSFIVGIVDGYVRPLKCKAILRKKRK